jgi:UDP-N-acetylglucosamine--N-acetylmuramyl-(pentapeptide) pyrophosphoryl-undecaprenol N-acetylglucosamine transferase
VGVQRPLRIVIAGGGTGGHVLPAISVHEELQRRGIRAEYLWIGSKAGVERQEAQRAGIPFTTVQTGKFRRYIDPKTIPDLVRIPIGAVQAAYKLWRYSPDVVFSTGGFVSVPTVAAARLFAPVLTHEQTAIVGLANKINARFARVFAVSYDATLPAARALHGNVIVTGNPVRRGLREGDAARGRAHVGFDATLPVIYITGGARGASALNHRVFDLLPWLLERAQVVHQTGARDANSDYDDAIRRRDALPDAQRARYAPREFIGPELFDLYAAADLIIGRAGAGTVAELAYAGKAAILVPLPLSGGGEQDRNAEMLGKAGAAVVLAQTDATSERLRAELDALLGTPGRLEAMAASAAALAPATPAAEALADALLALATAR